MDLAAIWTALPPDAKAAITGAAGDLLSKGVSNVWAKLTKPKAKEQILAAVYARWKEALLDDPAKDNLRHAFEDFFCRPPVQAELAKLLAGAYPEADIAVLEQQLIQASEAARCAIPDTSIPALAETLLESLNEALAETPGFEHPLQRSLDHLRSAEPAIRNYSIARRVYLDAVRRSCGALQARGFDAIGGAVNAAMDDVFVLPRLIEKRSEMLGHGTSKDPEPFPADWLLDQARRQPSVILGAPGAGKSTLLSYFAVRLANQSERLPIFYRARYYQEDRKCHHTDFWTCLHYRLQQDHHLRLPFGFFHRQKARGVVILLDGLDEVVPRHERLEVEKALAALPLPDNSALILSSRPHDYVDPVPDARTYEIREFDDDEIPKFIAQWRQVREPHSRRSGPWYA